MVQIPERVKRALPIGFAGVMGLVAVILLNQYLIQQRRKLEGERQALLANYPQPIEVIVAAKDLPTGTKLEIALLAKAAVPERFVQPYAVTSPNQLLGKITVAPIAAKEQILLNKLRRPDELPEGSTLSTLTPKGKRAVTILVDSITGVGGFVRPGDLVDVLWTIPGSNQVEGQVVTLFQDVPVLAVGSDLSAFESAGSKEANDKSQFMVTLALAPQETSFLLFAREQGRIQLSLRPRTETGPVAVAPANISTLLEMQLGIRPNVHPPKAQREVEVFQGSERKVITLPEQDEPSP